MMKREDFTIDEKCQAVLKWGKAQGIPKSVVIRMALMEWYERKQKPVYTQSTPKVSWAEQERKHQTGEWDETTIT